MFHWCAFVGLCYTNTACSDVNAAEQSCALLAARCGNPCTLQSHVFCSPDNTLRGDADGCSTKPLKELLVVMAMARASAVMPHFGTTWFLCSVALRSWPLSSAARESKQFQACSVFVVIGLFSPSRPTFLLQIGVNSWSNYGMRAGRGEVRGQPRHRSCSLRLAGCSFHNNVSLAHCSWSDLVTDGW
jgi:hypothetical protein